MSWLVFVFGTLKRGFPNHPRIAAGRFLANAVTAERFPLVIAGEWYSPNLIDEPGTGQRVSGELWEVDAATLADLDVLEGIGLPLGYHRRPIVVVRADTGKTLSALCYLKHRDRLGVIHASDLASYTDDRYVPPHARPQPSRSDIAPR